jgi:hypothetical protein
MMSRMAMLTQIVRPAIVHAPEQREAHPFAAAHIASSLTTAARRLIDRVLRFLGFQQGSHDLPADFLQRHFQADFDLRQTLRLIAAFPYQFLSPAD